VGVVDAAALGRFKKLAQGHGREKKNLLFILVVISLVGTITANH